MTKTLQNLEVFVYKVEGRTIFLDKKLVERYSEIVCPVDEKFMSNMIYFFGKDCKDDVLLSYTIASDMAEELHEYDA